jgi:hypothetical protein
MTVLGLLGFAFLVWLLLGLVNMIINPVRQRQARLVTLAVSVAITVWCLWLHGTLLALPR